jgi:hypothetical protein
MHFSKLSTSDLDQKKVTLITKLQFKTCDMYRNFHPALIFLFKPYESVCHFLRNLKLLCLTLSQLMPFVMHKILLLLHQ